MKITRFLFLAGVFFISLFASRSISMAIFHPDDPYLPEFSIANHEPLVTSVPINEQLNFLLIQTDRSQSPKPLGVWWVAIAPETPITMVSLYPNGDLESDEWVSEFKITHNRLQGKQLAPEFIEKVNEKNIPWDGYMILEPEAMEILVNSFGGLKINGKVMQGKAVTRSLLSLAPNSIEGRAFQTDVWTRLCQKALFARSSGMYELIKDELNKHSIVSPDFPINFTDFQTLLNTSNLNSCEVNMLKSTHSSSINATSTDEKSIGRSNGN